MEKENKELAKQRVCITPELKVTVFTDHGVIEDGTERVTKKEISLLMRVAAHL